MSWYCLAALVLLASILLGNNLRLRRRIRDLLRRAATDQLTGLLSRTSWEQGLQRELARARRRGGSVCLALLDLDDLKHINDRHGHRAGDARLRALADALRGSLRESDLAGRIGGDEFAVILPDCTVADAVAAMERVREGLHAGERCSVGVAGWMAAESHSELLDRADHALYEAKLLGGDRILAGAEARISTGVACSAEAPGQARRALKALAHEIEPETYEDLVLLTSELVSRRAVSGTAGSLEVRVWVTPHVVRAEVMEATAARVPEAEASAAGAFPRITSEFGLELVDRIADRWGAAADHVPAWFELRRPGCRNQARQHRSSARPYAGRSRTSRVQPQRVAGPA